jgi:M6 family metalloprotease-like protein
LTFIKNKFKITILTITIFLFYGCGAALEETPADGTEKQTQIEQPDNNINQNTEVNNNPTANIADKITREAGVFINFSGDAYDADNDTLSFVWKEGDTLLSTNQNFTKNDFSVGEHNITFTVMDAHGESASDNMIITIVPSNTTNDAPTALDQNIDTDEDNAIAFTLEINDLEGDALTMTITSAPSHGVIEGTMPNFTYTPHANFRGNDTITYKVNDGNSDSNDATVYILIRNVNDAPTADHKTISTNENSPKSVTLSGSDTEGDNLTYSLYTNPSHGAVTGATPNLIYTPQANYSGNDSFSYVANDGDKNSNIATILVQINDTPVAHAGENKSVKVGQSITITGTGDDSDGNILSYQWEKGDTVLSNTSSLTYTPTKIGGEKLTLTVTDDKGAIGNDTVTITGSKELPLVIIRVEFNDYTFNSDETVWNSKIFGNNEGALNHYYNEISYGKFQFSKAHETQGTINDGIITVKLNENHPGNVDDFPNRLVQAIKLTNDYIDYSQYDINNNNAISKDELQVMFLIAGGECSTGLSPGVWAHAWCMYGRNAEAPTLDGVEVMGCSTNGGYSRFGESHFNHGTDATVGIIAHELGHAALGLPDLYDTDAGGVSEGIGNFGLMGAGNWGNKSNQELPGTTPTHMTGWSKVRSGFVTPTVIESNKLNLEFRGTSFIDYQLYKINTGHDGEYFLLENRTNNGYDRGLFSLEGETDFSGGLSIVHIDDNMADNNDETHKLVDIEEADNAGLDTGAHRGHINNLYFSGNVDSFTPTTAPNSNLYDGTSSGLSITNISATGNSMSADIEIRKN